MQVNEPIRQLESQRLLLRVPVLKDAEAVFEEYASDSEVTRFLTWKPHRTVETVYEFMEGVIERNETGSEYSWLLSLPEEDRPIGMIAARVSGHMADIGYVLGRNHWNCGYMTEATKTISDWILSQSGSFRVWAVCDTENVGSARVLEKSHFEREGVLRRWMIHPNISPEPRDCFIYGRVR